MSRLTYGDREIMAECEADARAFEEAFREPLPVHVRWMTRRDLPAVARIDRAGFPDGPWDRAKFRSELRRDDTIGLAALDKAGRVVGFVVYRLRRSSLRIVRLAVRPTRQRMRVGTELPDRLALKLLRQGRDRLTAVVPEPNLAAQLFFRGCGLKATAVTPAGYRFEWRVNGE